MSDTTTSGDPVRGHEHGEGARERLSRSEGREFWRTLEDLAGADQLDAFVGREYPSQTHRLLDGTERREFLKLMGASLALAGLGSCTRQPREKILPYARTPEALVPGRPLYFASAMPWAGGALGVLVESHMGRPTKIEGNPDHPASLGTTDAITQAAVLELYDPARSRVVSHRGRASTWDAFLTALSGALAAVGSRRGAGLAVLTDTVTSPSLARELRALLADLPEARWHQWEPIHRDRARAGARLAFGEDLVARPRFADCDVVLSLEDDFLGPGPHNVRPIREFARRRTVRGGDTASNRLYVVESALSVTGANADHRLAIPSRDVEGFVRALARALGLDVPGGTGSPDARWVAAVAKDLEAHRGRCAILAGEGQGAAVHALVHALNARLGNAGKTVDYFPPAAQESVDHTASIGELVAAMRAGAVEVLVVLGGNPAYTAPADLDFAGALGKARLRVHLGLDEDETSQLCDWHVNETHWLESWGDETASDGTASVVQPLIAPLYGGRSKLELVAALRGNAGSRGHELVRAHWQQALGLAGAEFERAWRRALHDGAVAGSARAPSSPGLRDVARELPAPTATGAGVEVTFRPDPSVWDGRFANNGWLQELPKPLTKIVWDNAAHVSPELARELGVETGDVVAIEVGGRSVDLPVWVTPGQAARSIALTLGFGRRHSRGVGTGVGADVYRLRTSAAAWSASGANVRRTGARHELASTQGHDRMEGRDIVRVATVDRFRADPHLFDAGAHQAAHETSLFPVPPVDVTHAWGMVVDLNACTACNACVVACQAENNVPVVGREEVARGREMHWLRIDRYYEGPAESPEVVFQPILCMHCETAPCEYVCPVAATSHSPEGLNEMTYNRCVGTRYCANNCPYKVRRFNFFLYADWATESLALQRNPDVTVRSRGVMEKCTYCVQRINGARLEAKKEGRKVRDGEVVTACQQVCPADAIVFGDLNDPESRVSRLKKEPHEYGLLTELNTRPRTTYLARLKNPNPELASS